MSRGLELGAQVRVVVDLAVEDDLDRAVFVAERLRSRREVDDAQPPVPERGDARRTRRPLRRARGARSRRACEAAAQRSSARSPSVATIPAMPHMPRPLPSARTRRPAPRQTTAAREPGPCHAGQPPSSANCRNHSSSISSCHRRWRMIGLAGAVLVEQAARRRRARRRRVRGCAGCPTRSCSIGCSGPRSHSPIGAAKPCLPRASTGAGQPRSPARGGAGTC